ncbi:MAG: hypothetical protein EAS52_09035 [Parapedobacter sp.]|nr:MAG: hypothetical protein EAS52_09035 [Parapedobacter sp.]
MKNKRPLLTLFLIALVFTSAGFTSCSDKKEDIKTEEFPIPYPDGGDVITDKWDGKTGHRTVKYKADRHSELIGFYDDYASGNGWKRSESGQGVIYLHLNKGYTIDVGPPEDHVKDATLITLYVAD